MKKVVSMLLVFAMMMGMLPTTVFGTELPPDQGIVEELPDTEIIPDDSETIVCEHSEGVLTYLPNEDGSHTYTYSCCSETGTENCSGGIATCMEAAVCQFCESSYGETDENNHSFSEEWTYDISGHWHACACGEISDYEEHTRGEAELVRICTVCSGEMEPAVLTSSDFLFFAPENLLYDGNVKYASVVPNDYIVGCGDISLTYYDASGNAVEPVNSGTYSVGISVTDGANYYGASGLSCGDWSFTIVPRTVTMTSVCDSKEYDGKPLINETVEVTGDGWTGSDGADYCVTGNQKLVGTSENTFTYTLLEGTIAENYCINTVNGVLEVVDRTEKYAITMTANSGEFTYDGTEKSIAGFESNTFDVEEVTYTVEGLDAAVFGTEAGIFSVEVTGSPVVLDPDGNDVTAQFDVTIAAGEMVIQKADPVIGVISQGGTIYDTTKVEDAVLLREDESVEGVLQIINTEKFEIGTAEYEWQFVPTDSNNYNTITGMVELTITEDLVHHLEIVGILGKKDYTFGDEFLIEGATVLAVYLSGIKIDVTEDVEFDKDLQANQDKVEISYGDKNCVFDEITVSAKVLDNPVIELSQVSFDYDGEEKTPSIVVKDGERVLDASEYVVSYCDNVNAGTATVTVTDVDGGNYIVNGSASFEICKSEAIADDLPAANELSYNGKAQKLITAGNSDAGVMMYSLDKDGEYTTEIPSSKNAGVYTVWYYVAGDENHHDSEVMSVDVTIKKVPLSIYAKDKKITYGEEAVFDGVDYTGFVNGETEECLTGKLKYKCSYKTFDSVGNYDIVPQGLNAENYEITFVKGNLLVQSKRITVTAANAEKVYGENDPEFTYSVKGLVNGDSVSGALSREDGENKGSYVITQGTLNAGENYDIRFRQAEFVIHPKEIAKDDVILGEVLIYNGSVQTKTVSMADGITYHVEGNTGTNAGSYEMTVTGTDNYTGEVKLGWTIEKANAAVAVEPQPKKLVYNGSVQVLLDRGRTNDGSLVYSLNPNGTFKRETPKAAEAGSYTVYYMVLGDRNHTDSEVYSVTVNIGKFDITAKALSFETLKDSLYDGNEHVQTLSRVKYQDLEITYQIISGNRGTNAGKYTLMIRGTGNYTGTAFKTWNIHKKSLVITAKDQTITYGDEISNGEFTSVGQIDGQNVSVTLIPGTENVTTNGRIAPSDAKVFAKNEDLTSNYSVRYVDGKLTVLPDLSGMEGLDVYNVNSDAEENLKYVQNMLQQADSAGADEAVLQEWEAIRSQCSMLISQLEAVAAKKIWIENEMNRFDPEMVNSSDKDALEQVLEIVEELLGGNNLTEEERAELTADQKNIQEMLAVIELAALQINTDNIKNTAKVTAETVVLENLETLEAAKSELELALEENGNNYTADEKTFIKDEVNRISDAIQVASNANEVVENVDELPETVVPDEEEIVGKIEETKTVYDKLTDYEKSLISDDTKAKLDKLLVDMVSYAFTDEDGRHWKKKTVGGMTFTVNGPLSKFVGVKIDDVEVDSSNYVAESGSTIITFTTDYLNTLSYGEHILTVLYKDGETSGTFHVARNFGVLTPFGTDQSNLIFWIVVLVAVTAGAVGYTRRKRKNKKEA